MDHPLSNGGFKCSHSDNLVKYKVWPNNTYKSLHPSQKTWRKTTYALVQVNEHERYVAGKAERLAKKMASMASPSSAAAASSAGDAPAGQKPKLKKRKGPDDSSTESAEAADSDPQEIMGFLDDSSPWGWKLIENRIPCHEGWTFQGMAQTARRALLCGTQHRLQRSCARATRACSMQETAEQ